VKGNEPVEYRKGRSLEVMQEWLGEQTKTLIPGAIP